MDWCELCEKPHSSTSCYHPAQKVIDPLKDRVRYLEAQLTTLKQQLAEAMEIINGLETHYTEHFAPIHQERIANFLSRTPNDYVLVRRDDLQRALNCTDYGSETLDGVQLRAESIDRLKAALEKKQCPNA